MSAIHQILFSMSGVVTGQQEYTSAGTFSWVCPAGVTSVSVVCVGAGASSNGSSPCGGGALAYTNNVTVIPGNSYTVVVEPPQPGSGNTGNATFNGTTCGAGGGQSGGPGGVVLNGTGGAGGAGGIFGTDNAGGGGAGGYAGAGGDANFITGLAGSGGGGSGGGSDNTPNTGGGGGVGILGQGSSGAGGFLNGRGGSNGNNATSQNGAGYGGGGAQSSVGSTGGGGAVRIIWPGDVRQFPSTRTANE